MEGGIRVVFGAETQFCLPAVVTRYVVEGGNLKQVVFAPAARTALTSHLLWHKSNQL